MTGADATTRERTLDAVLYAYLREAEAGRPPERKDFLARHPGFAVELQAFFDNQDRAERLRRAIPPWYRHGFRATFWAVALAFLTALLISWPVVAMAVDPIFRKMAHIYESFPSLRTPWTARISLAIVSEPVLRAAGFLGFLLTNFLGLITVLAVRPKDAGADFATGVTSGLTLGITLAVVGLAWACILSLSVVASLADLQLLTPLSQSYNPAVGLAAGGPATLALGEPGPPPQAALGVLTGAVAYEALGEPLRLRAADDDARVPHPSAVLANHYPDLGAKAENQRGATLFPKVVTDLCHGTLAGFLAGMLTSLILGLGLGISETLAAGYLWRREPTVRSVLIPYLELVLPVAGLLGVAVALVLVEAAPTDVPSATWVYKALPMQLLLIALAVVGVTCGWRWPYRYSLYFAWGFTFKLFVEGSDRWPVLLIVIPYLAAAGLLIHYYQQRTRAQLTLPPE